MDTVELGEEVMNHSAQIVINPALIAEFCRRHHIRELALFGSALAGPFTERSDVDLLYEFQPGHSIGLGIVRLEQELSDLLGGRRVDLVPKKYLNRHMRDRILLAAQLLYAEG